MLWLLQSYQSGDCEGPPDMSSLGLSGLLPSVTCRWASRMVSLARFQGNVRVAQCGSVPGLSQLEHHGPPSLSYDIKPPSSPQILGIPLPLKVFFVFNAVVTVNEPDSFQMSSALGIQETALKHDEGLNSSVCQESVFLRMVTQTEREGPLAA